MHTYSGNLLNALVTHDATTKIRNGESTIYVCSGLYDEIQKAKLEKSYSHGSN